MSKVIEVIFSTSIMVGVIWGIIAALNESLKYREPPDQRR